MAAYAVNAGLFRRHITRRMVVPAGLRRRLAGHELVGPLRRHLPRRAASPGSRLPHTIRGLRRAM